MAEVAAKTIPPDRRNAIFLMINRARGMNGLRASLFTARLAQFIPAGDIAGDIKERWPSGLRQRCNRRDDICRDGALQN
jgi:hypothetical protein